MALTITIAGVTRTIDEGTLVISRPIVGVGRLTCDVTSIDGSVRPALDDEISVALGATVLFGGVIVEASEHGVHDVGLSPITTTIDAHDYHALTPRRVVTETLPAGTLKAALQILVTYLTGFGVTLDAAQVDGPALPALTFDAMPLSEVLAELMAREELSGYWWDISDTKVFGMYPPGAEAAPFNITDGDGRVDGDLAITPRRTGYANRILVRAGSGQAWVTQTWVANGTATSWLADIPAVGPTSGYVTVGGQPRPLQTAAAVAAWGYISVIGTTNFSANDTVTLGATTYTFKTALTPAANEVLIGASNIASLDHLNSAINADGNTAVYGSGTVANASARSWWFRETWLKVLALEAGAAGNSVTWTETSAACVCFHEGGIERGTLYGGGDASTAAYLWNATTHTLSVDTDPTPSAGILIALSYLAQYPFTVQAPNADTEPTAEQTAHGLWEVAIAAPDVFDVYDARTIAQDALSVRVASAVREARYATYEGGLRPGQTQTINSASRHVNTSFVLTDLRIRDQFNLLRYEVTAIEGTVSRGSFRDTYTAWGGAVTVVAGQAGSLGVPVGVPPTYSVGGSRALSVAPNPKAWTAIPEWIPVKAPIGFSAVARVWLWARSAGITCSARLVSGTDGITYGTTVATFTDVTSQTAVERTVSFTAVADTYYRVEIYPSADGEGVGCLGYLESA